MRSDDVICCAIVLCVCFVYVFAIFAVYEGEIPIFFCDQGAVLVPPAGDHVKNIFAAIR